MSRNKAHRPAVSEAAAAICEEVATNKEIKVLVADPERKGVYNKVMDALEDFSETLELERSMLGTGAWNTIKGVLYQIARAAVWSTAKGLYYLERFIAMIKGWARKIDLGGRIAKAWATLTRKKPEDVCTSAV